MRYQKITFLAAVLALSLAAGCSDEQKKDMTLQSGMEKLFGVNKDTPEEQAAGAFNEKDPDVRRTAIEQLSHKRWALRDPYLKRFSVLAQQKHEPDPSVRAVAVRVLGKAGDRKYMPQMIMALRDESPVVRWDAATVLNRLPDKDAVVLLQKLAIQDKSLDVRAAAARALRHYRTDSVYRTLLRTLDDDDFTVRAAGHKSLVFQTGHDKGYDPQNWAVDPSKVGQESLPEPVVRYKKRPWWDWFRMTKESEAIPKEKPGK
ncbi:MAG: HEAT repeat domain-containing protein [Phycisphaerae bacterium]|nr:HEAT repeat domain-containing protein [Phycisphaerae bacterium]